MFKNFSPVCSEFSFYPELLPWVLRSPERSNFVLFSISSLGKQAGTFALQFGVSVSWLWVPSVFKLVGPFLGCMGDWSGKRAKVFPGKRAG